MAASKGYHSYRGRESKWKGLVAVLLILVILAAGAVIVLQDRVLFDENGELQWDFSLGQETPEEPEDPVELDLVIQEPSSPPELHAQTLAAVPLTLAAWESVPLEDGDGCAVTLKDAAGKVYFPSQTASAAAVQAAEDTEAALTALTGGERYTIARVSCLLDPIAAKSDITGMGLQRTGSKLFYDAQNRNWLDPSKEAAQAYLGGIVREIAALGFQEILLTDFTFPTEGRLTRIVYPEAGTQESLTACLTALRTVLDEVGYESVLLSVELPAERITGEADEVSGQSLAALAAVADRVYAETTPEEQATLTAAVEAAGAEFVPELTAPLESGNYLLTGPI